MKSSIFVLPVAALCASAGALNITDPAQGISEIPVWPETLLGWIWGPEDPATVDIVIRYQFPNTTYVGSFIWKSNFSAEQRNITIPWIPLGLEMGTICQLGLASTGNISDAYDSTNTFTLVKANGNVPSASDYPATIYTMTSPSATYTITSTISPIPGLFTAQAPTTIFTTRSLTLTHTVISESGTTTATMSSLSVANSTLGIDPLPTSSISVTTVYRTNATTIRTTPLTKLTTASSAMPSLSSLSSQIPAMPTDESTAMATAAASSSAAATSSPDISFPTTPYSDTASDEGSSTVYVTVTETESCSKHLTTMPANSTSTSTSFSTSLTETTITDTGIGSPPTSSLVSPPPIPSTTTTFVTPNITSSPTTPSNMTAASTAPTTVFTGSGNSVYDKISVKTIYLAGLTVLALVGFNAGQGI